MMWGKANWIGTDRVQRWGTFAARSFGASQAGTVSMLTTGDLGAGAPAGVAAEEARTASRMWV